MNKKHNRWYKRLFTKLMWKLGVWQVPRYGRGEFSEKGIQLERFDEEPYTLIAGYSEKIQESVKNQSNEITKEWVDDLVKFRESRGMKFGTKMMVPFAFKCSPSVNMYAYTKGIEIINRSDL